MFQVALVGCLFLPLETDFRNFSVSGGQKKEEMVNSSLQETGFISP